MSAKGHLWTVGGLWARTIFPTEPPDSVRWSTQLEDPHAGPVEINGRLSRPAAARDLVILVHGLGGSSESAYMTRAAHVAFARDLASLRLNLRGADGRVGDFYHGGLTEDLAIAVRDLAPRFERVFALGFSLGGHIALRCAVDGGEPALAAVAAVCSPLGLAAGVDAIDRPIMAPYRRYVLRGLKENYARTAPLGRFPTSHEKLLGVRTIRMWDSLTVVPRFGFRDTDDYYARASVGPRLGGLRKPALLVASEHDPMILPSAIRPYLGEEGDGQGPIVEARPEHDLGVPSSRSNRRLTVRWVDSGGHLAFPRRVDLELGVGGGGQRSPDYLQQVLQWLRGVDLSPLPSRAHSHRQTPYPEAPDARTDGDC